MGKCWLLLLHIEPFRSQRCADFISTLNIELILCPKGDSAVINLISAINSSTAIDYHGAQTIITVLIGHIIIITIIISRSYNKSGFIFRGTP